MKNKLIKLIKKHTYVQKERTTSRYMNSKKFNDKIIKIVTKWFKAFPVSCHVMVHRKRRSVTQILLIYYNMKSNNFLGIFWSFVCYKTTHFLCYLLLMGFKTERIEKRVWVINKIFHLNTCKVWQTVIKLLWR